MSKKIIVIGSYIVALVMDTDRIPLKGETLKGRNFRQTFGGKGSNQAVQAKRLGADVTFATMIGNDSFGKDFLELCKNEKMDSSLVSIHPSLPTASGFIICGGGHNVITIDIGALNEITEKYIDHVLVHAGVGDILLIQQEIPLASALYAAQKAHDAGMIVILNPAPAYEVSDLDLSFVDIYTPNETEARVSIGLAPNDHTADDIIAEKLLNLGIKTVVMTLGEKGCLIANSSSIKYTKPYEIDHVIDSTGAGDAFNAALAVAISEGKDIENATRFANATAALACTKADTIPSFHTRDEVEKFIKSK